MSSISVVILVIQKTVTVSRWYN